MSASPDLLHLHLLLNHIPIIATILGLGLYICALLFRSDHLKQAALVIFVGTALISLPTYMTGNAAERAIRNTAGVSKEFVAAHNDAALIAFSFMELTGIFAWIGLWQHRRFSITPIWSSTVVLLLAIVTTGFMASAGNTGGQIRHPEIRGLQELASIQSAWLHASTVSAFVIQTKWVWAACETLHFIGLSLLMGVVLLVDLRMLGVIKDVSFAALHRLLPWAILGFALNVLTGVLFFIGASEQYIGDPAHGPNIAFVFKIALVLLAGVNALYFTMLDQPWALQAGDDAPFTSKLIAGSAVVMWIAIMWCGSMLPFIGNAF